MKAKREKETIDGTLRIPLGITTLNTNETIHTSCDFFAVGVRA
jgi:hypothetical protein